MPQFVKVDFRGRRAKVGGFIGTEGGGMGIFATYCPHCKVKVAFSREEARYFARRYGVESKRPFNRLVRYIQKRLEKRATEAYDLQRQEEALENGFYLGEQSRASR